MSFRIEVIADSITPDGIRVLTFQARYWRAIHSEFMTHRAFARNASSSRAKPVKRIIREILDDMAMPVHWGANRPGMQAKEELTGWRLKAAKATWRAAGYAAIGFARVMIALGLHKQVANRIIEPWSHIDVVFTTTMDGLENFFKLRDHPDAQPEMQVLAKLVKLAVNKSRPRELRVGEWHLPYFREEDIVRVKEYVTANPEFDDLWVAQAISAARCARVSYSNHDGTQTTIDEDIALFRRLIFDKIESGDPIHASPTEHQFTPDEPLSDLGEDTETESVIAWRRPGMGGNLGDGVIQLRKLIEKDAAAPRN